MYRQVFAAYTSFQTYKYTRYKDIKNGHYHQASGKPSNYIQVVLSCQAPGDEMGRWEIIHHQLV